MDRKKFKNMKLWKTLLPVATLGATAACVVPMASCSKAVFSTSDITWKMTDIHGEASITTKDQYNDLVKEYFSSSKHIAEDFGTYYVQSAAKEKEALEEQVTSGSIESYKMDFNVTVSNIGLTPQTLNLGTSWGQINGYVINVTFNMTQRVETTGKTDSEGYRTDTVSTGELSAEVKNGFAVIKPGSEVNDNDIAILGHQQLDWTTEMTFCISETGKEYKNNKHISTQGGAPYNMYYFDSKDNNTYSEEEPFVSDSDLNVESTYLGKVTITL